MAKNFIPAAKTKKHSNILKNVGMFFDLLPIALNYETPVERSFVIQSLLITLRLHWLFKVV